MKNLRWLLASLCIVSSNGQAVELQVVDGKLVGALSVVDRLDVWFREGTCAEVFSGCDEPSDFHIGSASGAGLLLDHVFVDGALGLFDSIPSLTFGCADPISCVAVVPSSAGWLGPPPVPSFVIGASNTTAIDNHAPSPVLADRFVSVAIPPLDTSVVQNYVWAVFTPSQLPEPSTLALLGIALASIGFARRR